MGIESPLNYYQQGCTCWNEIGSVVLLEFEWSWER